MATDSNGYRVMACPECKGLALDNWSAKKPGKHGDMTCLRCGWQGKHSELQEKPLKPTGSDDETPTQSNQSKQSKVEKLAGKIRTHRSRNE